MTAEEKNPWETVSSGIMYENQWLRIIEDKVITPAKKPGIYSIVHFKNIAVAIVPLDKEYNTWIVGQYRYPQKSYEWEVPEGGCPDGSTPLETAKKELLEECGLIAGKLELILQMQLSNSATDEISYTFVAKDIVVTKSEPEETEVLQIKKIPFDELYQMVLQGKIKDALSIASILKTKILIDSKQL